MQLAPGGLAQATVGDDRVDDRQQLGGSGFAQLSEALDCRRQSARLGVAQQPFAVDGIGFEQSGNEIGRLGHGVWRVARGRWRDWTVSGTCQR